ncbi:MAG: MMPL family transporter [Candidatus Eisenbacteria sp.]|nr:MMPL family transporter [Candidatus Eisenbacteria bacterium]
MQRFAQLVLRLRIPIVLATIGITAFLAYHLKDLTINSDLLSYMPSDDASVILFNKVGDEFGGNYLAMVALETDDIFNPVTLDRVSRITQKFQHMTELSHVISLTDVLDMRKTEWGLEVGKLIDKDDIPQDPAELRRLREYTLSKKMYRGNLVSSDGRVTLIIARLKAGTDKIDVSRQMKAIVQETEGKEIIYYAGMPFQTAFLSDLIRANLKIFLPLVTLLVIATLYFSFRSFRGVFLPLTTVLLATVWTLGTMGLLNMQLTMASEVLPVLLIAIGSAYGIHMLAKYNEDIRLGDNRATAITHSLTEVGRPILLTGVTTMIGFLSFLPSDLGIIREFGAATGLGVLFATILSITLVPAVLSFLKRKTVRLDHRGIEINWATRFLDSVARFVPANQRLFLVLGGVVIIAAALAIPKLQREVNYASYFEEDSEIRKSEDMMEAELGGAIPVQIYIQGNMKDPLVLREMIRLERFLDAQPDINGAHSIADLICEMNRVMNGHYSIPPTKRGVANLWFFLEGNEVLPQLVNDDATEGLIQAKLGSVNTKVISTVVDVIEDYLENELTTDMAMVRMSRCPEGLAQELLRERAKRISSKIKWATEKRGLRGSTPESFGCDVIHRAIARPLDTLDNTSIRSIAITTEGYLRSQEADVDIESEEVIQSILTHISTTLQSCTPTQSDLVDILERDIPTALYSEEPEILEYMAEAIFTIIGDEQKRVRVEQVIEELRPTFSPDLIDDQEFAQDLRGDLWEINEDWVAVAASKYPTVVATADSHARTTLTAAHTGIPLLYHELDRKIMRSQGFGLATALLLIFLLLSLHFRSLVGGLISTTPILLCILVNFILMVIFRVPLDELTILISNISMGVGIDYSIHFITRFRVELARGETEVGALQKTLQTAGRAILINALTVAIGFLVLVLGDIVPMRWFGYILAITMVTASVSAITVLPSLLLVSRAGFVARFDRGTGALATTVAERFTAKGKNSRRREKVAG